MYKERIIKQMKEIFKEIPFGMEHTLKVLKNAEDIMEGENVSNKEKELISVVAILHDIGAVGAQRKYGSIEGVYQEKEGPAVARKILEKEGLNSKNIERIGKMITLELEEILLLHSKLIDRTGGSHGIRD